MPIYEFYCPACHAIYSFWSRTIETERCPGCPKSDQHQLQRQVSRFAVVSANRTDTGEDSSSPPIDETKMENALSALASEAEGVKEDDPRAAARLMHRFSDMTGMRLGENMEKALQRLEAGEDPETVEAEMGDLLEGDENPFVAPPKRGSTKRAKPPRRDDTLYEMS